MDHTEIDRRAREINAENTVRQKGTRTRGAVISYFGGEDLTGQIHRNAETYAAFIAVVTDTGVSGFKSSLHKNTNALREELGEAFKEAGFVTPEGELSIPGRDSYDEIPSSIGPIMPAILAILQVEHGIDSTEAVRQYRPDSVDIIHPDEEDDRDANIVERPEKNWLSTIRNAPGFEPDAAAYIYALELERLSDSSTWYYVGKSRSRGVESRIRSHTRQFTQSRVVDHGGEDILVGDHNYSIKPKGTTHDVVDVERIVSIPDEDLAILDDSDAESCFISELERRTSYEIALDHETTNVLGGK